MLAQQHGDRRGAEWRGGWGVFGVLQSIIILAGSLSFLSCGARLSLQFVAFNRALIFLLRPGLICSAYVWPVLVSESWWRRLFRISHLVLFFGGLTPRFSVLCVLCFLVFVFGQPAKDTHAHRHTRTDTTRTPTGQFTHRGIEFPLDFD